MPWPKEKKALTQERITTAAAKLFMQRGYEAVSIDDIMSEAQLTSGGFYHHFTSKSALYHDAIIATIEQGKAFFAGIKAGELSVFIDYYLSEEHYYSSTVCPLSSITPDITRRSKTIRTAYDTAFNTFVTGIQKRSSPNSSRRISNSEALQIAICLIGTMTLAKAIDNADSVKDILNAGQRCAKQLLKSYTQ